MERPDIISGLKQAIERGSSIEQAKRSFINSGYPSQDVEDSANSLLGYNSQGYSITSNVPQQKPIQFNQPVLKPQPAIPQPTQSISQQNFRPLIQPQQYSNPQQVQGYSVQQKSKKSVFMIILIILLALILLVLVGALIGIMLFREQFVDFISKLGFDIPL